MFPEAATIARRRHLATIIVRSLVAAMIAIFVWRVLDSFAEFAAAHAGVPPIAAIGEVLARSAAWPVLAGLLLMVERPLLRWLVPPPQPGCPNCGHSLRNLKSPVCPECGSDLTGGAGARP